MKKQVTSSKLLFIAVIIYQLIISTTAIAATPPLSCTEMTFGGGTSAACLDYSGDSWTIEGAADACGNLPGAAGGSLVVGSYCDQSDILGVCVTGRGTPEETLLSFYTGDIAALETACVNYMRGEWEAPVAGNCTHNTLVGPPGTPLEPACTEYSGDGWDNLNASEACSAQDSGQYNPGTLCESISAVGYCTLAAGTPDESKIYYYTGETADLQYGCETINAGVWTTIDQSVNLMDQAVEALTSDDLVTVRPDGCDDVALNLLIENKKAIEFAPVVPAQARGLIVYPGGDVDPRAYAVAARMIAEKGFFVAIVPFPGRLAITDPMRATGIIAAHPEITDWAMAGHSLGGVAGSIYAAANPMGKIKAVAWWASYPPESVDLSQAGLKGLSVHATLDGKIDLPAMQDAMARLPGATYVVDINGGNHAQFGYYGDQDGDNPARISRDYQHELFTGATIHLLNRIGVPDNLDVVNSLYANLDPMRMLLGMRAQVLIAGLSNEDLNVTDIDNEVIVDQEDFQYAKPEFPADGSSMVAIKTYGHQMANASDISLPPIYEDELWIKMKSQAAFVEQYGVAAENEDQCGCDQINKMIFRYALTNTNWRIFLNYIQRGVHLTYGDDYQSATGPEWLEQSVSIDAADSSGGYTLKASRLEVPTTVPAPYGGNFYCKVWSPTAALKFIVDAANQ